MAFLRHIADKTPALRIVSGRSLGLIDEEAEGAYVFCIQQGSVASQLHEEVHEGSWWLLFLLVIFVVVGSCYWWVFVVGICFWWVVVVGSCFWWVVVVGSCCW